MDATEPTTLIVNADDFGWSTGVNAGIVAAHREGILTSATALVNFPRLEETAAAARTAPDLGVGLHLNIAHGPPVAPPSSVPSLLGPDGRFPGPGCAARRLLLGRIVPAELDRELDAQLARFRGSFGEPTHLDSHKHLHVFGCFVPAVVRLARALQAPRARCPRERVSLRLLATPQGLKAALLAWRAGALARAFRRAGVWFPTRFLGTLQSRRLTPACLCRIVDALRPGVTELMCHPGLPSDDDHDVAAHVACTPYRGPQAAALRDASVLGRVRQSRVTLSHYGSMPFPSGRPRP